MTDDDQSPAFTYETAKRIAALLTELSLLGFCRFEMHPAIWPYLHKCLVDERLISPEQSILSETSDPLVVVSLAGPRGSLRTIVTSQGCTTKVPRDVEKHIERQAGDYMTPVEFVSYRFREAMRGM